MRTRTVEVAFPLGGVNRTAAFQRQPPYTTYDCMDVRPRSLPGLREQGGTRAGIEKIFPMTGPLPLGDGPITFLGKFVTISGATQTRHLLAEGTLLGAKHIYYSSGGVMMMGGTSNLASPESAEVRQKLYVLDGSPSALKYWNTSTHALVAAGCCDPLHPIPTGCTHLCRYRDRIVIAGPDHQWYMSRQGNVEDWAFDKTTDPARALSGENSDAGVVGEPITAMLPVGDDMLLFGGMDSLWLMRGDPGYSGQIDAISREFGILNGTSLCMTGTGEVVFLAKQGLYILPPGFQSLPEPFSDKHLPAQLYAAGSTVAMGWDEDRQGIEFSITPTTATDGTHYFLDWRTRTFWPQTYPTAMQPRVMLPFYYAETATKYCLFGCKDGWIRKRFDSCDTDDGTAFTPYVKIGPINLSQTVGTTGKLRELLGVMASGSEDVTWEIFAGRSAEEALTATTAYASGTWSAGRNLPDFPMTSAPVVVLKLSGTPPWAVEQIEAIMDAYRGRGILV